MIRQDDAKTHSNDARIDELEQCLVLLRESCFELGDEIYRQQRQIGQLEQQLKMLSDRMRALAAREPEPAPLEERPPHY